MVEVIDNIIPVEYQLEIKKFLYDKHLPLYYNRVTVESLLIENHPQFVHTLMDDGTIKSKWLCPRILQYFTQAIPEFQTHKLDRCKINFNVPHRKKDIKIQHKDSDTEGAISYIYFANDSDGPTRIYHGEWNEQKIYPVQGRAIKLSSNLLHSGNIPVKYEGRYVINFVFEPK